MGRSGTAHLCKHIPHTLTTHMLRFCSKRCLVPIRRIKQKAGWTKAFECWKRFTLCVYVYFPGRKSEEGKKTQEYRKFVVILFNQWCSSDSCWVGIGRRLMVVPKMQAGINLRGHKMIKRIGMQRKHISATQNVCLFSSAVLWSLLCVNYWIIGLPLASK